MFKFLTVGIPLTCMLALVGCSTSTEAPSLDSSNEEESSKVQQEAIEQQPAVEQRSTVEQKIKCEEFGEENYQNMYMDDGWIEFEYYYSPVLDTCILQREEFGPDPDMYVWKLYDMFTKEIILYYATFDGIGCMSAQECVDSLDKYNAKKKEILDMR
ncbi:hypothetical protein COU75_02580 [Candidatus Peregrinibacteria bacterium CG10_big_fil_rev_8_21_14_0_10_42_8]|nr:MAG: hypothetical protein COU75_02580 [Candidatus Peregrinibacteria bacterium CG10_big_fil_rev_8_21_14_0_10_42_8]